MSVVQAGWPSRIVRALGQVVVSSAGAVVVPWAVGTEVPRPGSVGEVVGGGVFGWPGPGGAMRRPGASTRSRRPFAWWDVFDSEMTSQRSPASGFRRARVGHWRRWFATIVGVGGVIVVIVFGLAWRASGEIMDPPQAHYAWTLASYPALAAVAEPLTIRSSTGVTILGRLFPGRSDATIVLSHGFAGNQDEMLPVASALHAAGFTVVTYNERGRDGSGGSITMGPFEARDLRSVIDAVVRHRHVNPDEIGAFGFSLGADITILEAAGDPRVKAVVVDGSAPYLTAYAHERLTDIFLHPTARWTPLSSWLLELRTGVDLADNRPSAVVARISPRPILFIQSLADTEVLPWETIDTYRHARAPRQLWLVKGEQHEATVAPGGAATSARVSTFFAQALLHHR